MLKRNKKESLISVDIMKWINHFIGNSKSYKKRPTRKLLIDDNGISTRLGLFNPYKFRNHVHYALISSFSCCFLRVFCAVIWYQVLQANLNNLLIFVVFQEFLLNINNYMISKIPDIGLGVRVFANGPGDLGSIPGRVIPKTQKMVLDASLLNTQHYKVRIKGKVEQSREGVAPSPTYWCSSYRKGSLRVTLD